MVEAKSVKSQLADIDKQHIFLTPYSLAEIREMLKKRWWQQRSLEYDAPLRIEPGLQREELGNVEHDAAYRAALVSPRAGSFGTYAQIFLKAVDEQATQVEVLLLRRWMPGLYWFVVAFLFSLYVFWFILLGVALIRVPGQIVVVLFPIMLMICIPYFYSRNRQWDKKQQQHIIDLLVQLLTNIPKPDDKPEQEIVSQERRSSEKPEPEIVNKGKGSRQGSSTVFYTHLSLDEVREKLQTQPVYHKTSMEERRLVFDHSYFYIPNVRFDDAYRTTMTAPPPMFNRSPNTIIHAQLFLTAVHENGTRIQLMIGNRREISASEPFSWAIPTIVIICTALIIAGVVGKTLVPCLIGALFVMFTMGIAVSGDSANSWQYKSKLTSMIMELLEYDSAYEKTLYFEKA